MKRPTDKDLRLYARLSDVDGDLILDSAIPAKAAAPVTVRHPRWEAFKDLLSRPWAASLAVSTVMVSLVVIYLLAMGGFRDPAVEPPAHGTYPEVTSPNLTPDTSISPTYENAASLRKGMSLSELVALMGTDCTRDGSRYIFTLDTGEQLAVDTEFIYGGDTGSRVIGFEWLGGTAQAVNPMGIDAEILQKVQEYASDKVIPVYTMTSLIDKYREMTLPSAEEVLEGAELCYLRTGTDGKTVVLDGEGKQEVSSPVGGDFSLLDDVSALFDESVRVKTYYPIMTSAERGAVYIVTSVGDYILYLHGDHALKPDNWDELTDAVPYLVPAAQFHLFAYNVVSDNTSGEGQWEFQWVKWIVSEERLAIIAPYEIGAEGYQKPVNLATPEAAAQVEVGMEFAMNGFALEQLLGNNLSSEKEQTAGLYYWELTDGRGLVVTTKKASSYSGIPDVYTVATIHYFDSAEDLDKLGKPSLMTAEMVQVGMSLPAAEAVMGPHSHTLVSISEPCTWTWREGGATRTLTVNWGYYTTDGTIQVKAFAVVNRSVTSVYEDARYPIPEDAVQVTVGMTQAKLTALLGQGLSTEEQRKQGVYYWKLTDGQSFFVYCRPDADLLTETAVRVTDTVWLESWEPLDALGSPSYAVASKLILSDMSREAVVSLLGKAPAGTYISSSTSASQLSTSSWTWDENGETYTFTVHWLTVRDHINGTEEIRVGETTLTEALAQGEKPSPASAEQVTVGMTDNATLSQMNGTPTLTRFCGDGILYVWELSDGRFFGVLLENRAPAEVESLVYRFSVTHTFYWDTAEEIGQPTKANAERITAGMSYAAVIALVGEPDSIRKRENGTIQKTFHWLTDRNLLSVEIDWMAAYDTETGTLTHTVSDSVIAVG